MKFFSRGHGCWLFCRHRLRQASALERLTLIDAPFCFGKAIIACMGQRSSSGYCDTGYDRPTTRVCFGTLGDTIQVSVIKPAPAATGTTRKRIQARARLGDVK